MDEKPSSWKQRVKMKSDSQGLRCGRNEEMFKGYRLCFKMSKFWVYNEPWV
jgi:hypothetical protein